MAYPADQFTVKMASYAIDGNVIDHTWNKFILTDTKIQRPDPVAMLLLAEIVYWYRPKKEKGEDGSIKIYKKYKADLLQKSYDDLQRDLGFTHDQLKEAFRTLERIGVSARVFRTIQIHGMKVSNVLFISLNIEQLIKLQNNELNKCLPSGEIPPHPPGNSHTPPPEFPRTNTETSSETSSEKQQQGAVAASFHSEIEELLKDVDIPQADKTFILQSDYPIEIKRNAIQWAIHPKTKINKTLQQAIKWALVNNPSVPEEEIDLSEENKKIAQEIHSKCTFSNGQFFELLSKRVEIGYSHVSNVTCIDYIDNGFKEQLLNALRKINIKV